MSYRLDLVIIDQQPAESRFALTIHNLSDKPIFQWALHFTMGRWINHASLTHGQVEQVGSYCVLTPDHDSPLLPNGHFYTEFTIGTQPFTYLMMGLLMPLSAVMTQHHSSLPSL